MTKSTTEFEQVRTVNSLAMRSNNVPAHPQNVDAAALETSGDALAILPQNERELLNEMARAIRTIAYGSILLTIHDGRLVEISKTTRLRNSPAKC